MLKKVLAIVLFFTVVSSFDKPRESEAMAEAMGVGAAFGGLPGAAIVGGVALAAVLFGLGQGLGNFAMEQYNFEQFAAEHTKGKRPSTKGKHEKGQARKSRDAGKEKGDARRNNPWGRG